MPNDIGCWWRLPFPLLADCLNPATARSTPLSTSTKYAVCVCVCVPPPLLFLLLLLLLLHIHCSNRFQQFHYRPLLHNNPDLTVCVLASLQADVSESVRLSLYFVSAATEDRAIDFPVTVFPPAVNNNSPPPPGSFQSTTKIRIVVAAYRLLVASPRTVGCGGGRDPKIWFLL